MASWINLRRFSQKSIVKYGLNWQPSQDLNHLLESLRQQKPWQRTDLYRTLALRRQTQNSQGSPYSYNLSGVRPMKGMQKIKRGKHHRCGSIAWSQGLIAKITPYVIGGNMTSYRAISEFKSTQLLRPDVFKPVWHNSLRLPKGGESVNQTSGRHSLTIDMTRMGFTDTHLRCYILHDDADGQHIYWSLQVH